MRKILYILLILSVASCGVSKKKTTYSKTRKVSVAASKPEAPEKVAPPPKKGSSPKDNKADHIIKTALKYSGVRYKYGGTTKKGMDCSGLLYVAFGENDIDLPRTSYHMAEEGKRIRLNEVEKGDLLFFRTSKRAKRINHVGMVVAVENDEIKFVHASTSRGVIVSSLREGYWNSAFVKATRVL
ncbi:C40 family peptidase [Pseudozobellia thermophila]|uniref:Cell wall-associated hydrolase, NlpC family n=1 Tax=Pseudozobellia thermophila TaxID=192903 RepID=A0A1M6D557_9FLAO|nr:C40 family peptidase [Pseudozobellia thermophila]SHI68251.1 Cell wall-associated hydrolase, NlpC family [Pseudozobellia thermophila]